MTTNTEYAAMSVEFIGQRAACVLAGRSPSWLLRMAMLGRIKVQMEPGEPTRYLRSDVQSLAGMERATRQRR